MTSAELKTLLLNVANIVESGESVFSGPLDTDVISVLQGLNEQELSILSILLNMPLDTLKAKIPQIIALLQSINTLYTTNQAAELVTMLRDIAGRSFLLMIIARFF